MASKRTGNRTMTFLTPPHVITSGTIAGDMEGAGPLGHCFDMVLMDDTWGEKSWEKAECKMFEEAVRLALAKAGWRADELNCLLGGDLMNQIITANYAARELQTPFLGLYGACSTMAESMLLGSMLIDGGFLDKVACVASSHFSTAERQYRMPLEMGTTSPPTAQRTVTGAGAILLSTAPMPYMSPDGQDKTFQKIKIPMGTIGRVIDYGITDSANMGAAMAPAAADTIAAHLKDSSRTMADYDVVITGDLGKFGSELLFELCEQEGIDLAGKHLDCGNLIFHPEQNVDCGGSGCGCSAITLGGYLLHQMEKGVFQRVLFLATGALMSPVSSMQGESIPGIAHAIVLERG